MERMQKTGYESALQSLKQSFLRVKDELEQFRSSFRLSAGGMSLVDLWMTPRGVGHLVNALCLGCSEEQGSSQGSQQRESKREEMPSHFEINSSFHQQEGNQLIEVRPSYTRGPYRSYSLEEKQKAVSLMESSKLSMSQVSRQLSIPCKNIKRWMAQGLSRKKGGGRRRYSPKMEAETYEWILSSFQRGATINSEQIQTYALSRSEDANFKASRGWFKKFILRFNLKDQFVIA